MGSSPMWTVMAEQSQIQVWGGFKSTLTFKLNGTVEIKPLSFMREKLKILYRSENLATKQPLGKYEGSCNLVV